MIITEKIKKTTYTKEDDNLSKKDSTQILYPK